MCLSRPKMPKASTVMQAPPMPPPPPTETADEVINKADKDRRMKKKEVQVISPFVETHQFQPQHQAQVLMCLTNF